MFVGRDKELASLNKLYADDVFQMVIIYGRRRVGKTTLISEFISGKPTVFFTVQEANNTLNLSLFSKKIYSFFDIPESAGAFTNWYSALEFVANKASEKRFVLVFDEFPYAANADRSLRSVLQTFIDHSYKNTSLFIILSGSQVGFMENEVLGYSSPLFGRRTAQIKLDGFDYYDAGKMLGSFSSVEKLMLYACVGGTPHYLAQIKANESFTENIKRLYFDISGFLYNEPMMLLQQELREPAMYNSIINAIAGGASRLNEIATAIGEDSPKVSKYLQILINLQIINKIYPFGENPQNSRRGIYRIADNCYDFWYSFVFQNIQEIESGSGDLVMDNEVSNERLSSFIGKPQFETVCLQYLQRANRSHVLPFTATSFGTWWGNDPMVKAQTDFDVIAADRNGKKIVVGECKWQSSVDVEAEIRKLADKDHLLAGYTERYYYVFTKTQQIGFTESVKAKAVTVDMLFEV